MIRRIKSRIGRWLLRDEILYHFRGAVGHGLHEVNYDEYYYWNGVRDAFRPIIWPDSKSWSRAWGADD